MGPMRWLGLLVLPVLLAVPLLAACGDDGGKAGSPTGAAAGATPLTDKEYLAVFCKGVSDYYEAVNTQPTADGIAKVVKAYIASLQGVEPPADLKDYQAEYIKYLQDAVNDPTRLLTQKPPLPAESVRSRLAGEAKDVAECKYPTFLGTPSP